jgi:cation diffusion facilitator family transporter
MLRDIPQAEARAGTIAVIVGISLLVLKFIAYYLTGSVAIFSDAMESIVNVLASLFAFYSLSLAHEPADKEHPYGHGKIEFFSAGFEGGLILAAAIVITVRTISVMIAGQIEVQKAGFGLILVALAMVVNGGVGVFLIHTGQRKGSLTLEADGHHLLSDAITSIAVLMALAIVALTGWTYADPIVALLMAVYIGYLGIRLLRRAGAGLMDRQDMADEVLLCQILDGHVGACGKEPRICGYHKLRHRHSGRYHWVDFHIMVPWRLDIAHGHKIASTIEYEIEQAVGEGKASAHVEPCTDQKCPACAARPVSASPQG